MAPMPTDSGGRADPMQTVNDVFFLATALSVLAIIGGLLMIRGASERIYVETHPFAIARVSDVQIQQGNRGGPSISVRVVYERATAAGPQPCDLRIGVPDIPRGDTLRLTPRQDSCWEPKLTDLDYDPRPTRLVSIWLVITADLLLIFASWSRRRMLRKCREEAAG